MLQPVSRTGGATPSMRAPFRPLSISPLRLLWPVARGLPAPTCSCPIVVLTASAVVSLRSRSFDFEFASD